MGFLCGFFILFGGGGGSIGGCLCGVQYDLWIFVVVFPLHVRWMCVFREWGHISMSIVPVFIALSFMCMATIFRDSCTNFRDCYTNLKYCYTNFKDCYTEIDTSIHILLIKDCYTNFRDCCTKFRDDMHIFKTPTCCFIHNFESLDINC